MKSPKWQTDDKRIRAEAEDIFQRYKAGEFEIDDAKARKISFEVELEDRMAKSDRIVRSESINGNLVDAFALFVSRYQMNKHILATRWLGAHDLILGYNALRSNGCLKVGNAILKRIEKQNEKFKRMKKENAELTAKLKKAERNYLECTEEKQSYEIRNQELQTTLTDIRKQDMQNSLNQNTPTEESTLEPSNDGGKGNESET